jgi:hypothetical protein
LLRSLATGFSGDFPEFAYQIGAMNSEANPEALRPQCRSVHLDADCGGDPEKRASL